MGKNGGSFKVFRPLATLTSGKSLRVQLVILKKSSVECIMNDDSVRTPSKNPSTSTKFSIPVISVEETRAACIICRKESKGLRLLRRDTRDSP